MVTCRCWIRFSNIRLWAVRYRLHIPSFVCHLDLSHHEFASSPVILLVARAGCCQSFSVHRVLGNGIVFDHPIASNKINGRPAGSSAQLRSRLGEQSGTRMLLISAPASRCLGRVIPTAHRLFSGDTGDTGAMGWCPGICRQYIMEFIRGFPCTSGTTWKPGQQQIVRKSTALL